VKSVVLTSVFFLVAAQCADSQVVNQRVTDSDGAVHLLGLLTEEALSSPPFSEWYTQRVDLYDPDIQVLNTTNNLQDYEIEVFMGTWCGDSQREVPRLMKTLRELKFPHGQLSIVGVNRTKEQFKQSPNGEQATKNIHRVPTIIFYKNGKEVNRIVESPVVSMEQDIRSITSGREYTSNYQIVARLDDLLKRKGPSIVLDEAESIARELKPVSVKSSELASYGYVQLYQKNIDKALAIFEINRLLFPDVAIVYESLAAANYDRGNYGEAKSYATKALQLDPNNESALKILAELASK
jgi:tetratricopeptide (TPR) repeat protein